MKTITIKAWQCETGYKVHYFSNTCEVAIGSILSREQWQRAIGHPRANMICTGLEPVSPSDENELLSDFVAPEVISHEVALDNESGQTYVDARAFDALAIEMCGLHGWCSQSTLDDAMMPDPGNNNLGTAAIKGKVARSAGLQAVRIAAARECGLDRDEISRVAYRAQALPVLQKIAKLVTAGNQPF